MIKEKVLAIIFLTTLLFLLLTEAIPIMYSLKNSVFEALNFKSDFISEQSTFIVYIRHIVAFSSQATRIVVWRPSDNQAC